MQIVYIPSESMSVQGKKDEIYKRYGKDWNIREQGGGGNVKKCAVGKYPKSEKLGSAGQAACCACAHSRYLTGGSPSGLRV